MNENARRAAVDTALRVRVLAVEAAKVALADALAIETAASEKLARLLERIRAETKVASDVASGDARVEEFGAWLRTARALEGQMSEQLKDAEAGTFRARSGLMVAKTAEAAVETLIANRNSAEKRADQKASQAAIDEHASRACSSSISSERNRGA